MDPNEDVKLLYGVPVKSNIEFGVFRPYLKDGAGQLQVASFGYDIEQIVCNYRRLVCSISSTISYDTKHAGHLQVSKRYNPNRTSPIERFSLYELSEE